MPTQLTAHPSPHMYVCLQDCTRHVLDRLWRRPALIRKSYPCQVCTSLMDGGYIQRYQSLGTYHTPKKRQSRISLRPHLQLVRNQGPVARRRSERHPCDSRQEPGGRWAEYKEGSGPRMQVLFFPSNAFMASARSFNMSKSMLQ